MSTGDNAVDARIVEALASVSTGENAVAARIVKVPQNQSWWFPRSESEVSTRRRCVMMPRMPMSALSAWTPLVNVRPLFSASVGIVTTLTAERSWRKQALKGVVTDVRGRL